jgi:EAL domain-containing protein (putative c-di-GMP-specific phosphodiesterase class I)
MTAHGAGAILVVDDDEAMLKTYAAILPAAGFSVRTASNGKEALALLASPCDALLSDIHMPGLDGLALLKRVRQLDLDLQVVLITGEPNVETAIKAVEFGALRYLTKPVNVSTVIQTMADAVTMTRLSRTKREALAVLGGNEQEFGDRAALEVAFDALLPLLRMAYQPIVDWRARRVWAYEALIRVDTGRLREPTLIVAAAERLDRTHELGRLVRATIAKDLAAVSLPPDVHLFVNLHPAELLDPHVGGPMDPLISHASRTVYEITERKSLSSLDAVRSAIARLKRSGFRIAVDDLGAGSAGLSMFAAIEPNVMKIDVSLIRRIEESVTMQRVVRSLIDLGRDLRIKDVIVEGIETVSERDTSAMLGADLMQGFLFGRAEPPFVGITA